MFKTLYAKLAAVFVLLLVSIGGIYLTLTFSSMRAYTEEVNQRVSRDLARDLIMDRNLVAEGRINEAALKNTFHQYMVINPSIEIYLLDLDGKILSYSADPQKVKRRYVSLEAIHQCLREKNFPVIGDDPRSHDKQKAFSAALVPNENNPQGYLYVVLQGEEFDSINNVVRDNYIFRLTSGALLAGLVFGLLAGLLLFYFLTRRLSRLTQHMENFRQADFHQAEPFITEKTSTADEIDRLAHTFDAMANRIREQLDELVKKDNTRRELVAQVSHDLRTPLASLRGYLETLQLKKEELTEAETQEYIEIALNHSERLSRLVGELFDLARLEAIDQLKQMESFSVAELVQDVVQKFQLKAKEKNIGLSMHVDADLPFVRGDIGLIERALENLIENALRHTSEGNIDITLAKQQSGVQITVHDTGKGIPEKDLPHIFDRFYQAQNAHREGSHSGLGLAIVKRILNLHHSEITVRSEPGKGSDFCFKLLATPA